nr:MAG TPA: hypothetical protein [Bacteriophage sp.]
MKVLVSALRRATIALAILAIEKGSAPQLLQRARPVRAFCFFDILFTWHLQDRVQSRPTPLKNSL